LSLEIGTMVGVKLHAIKKKLLIKGVYAIIGKTMTKLRPFQISN